MLFEEYRGVGSIHIYLFILVFHNLRLELIVASVYVRNVCITCVYKPIREDGCVVTFIVRAIPVSAY